jgi:dCTP deaminase
MVLTDKLVTPTGRELTVPIWPITIRLLTAVPTLRTVLKGWVDTPTPITNVSTKFAISKLKSQIVMRLSKMQGSAILSDVDILSEIEQGHIVIEPFDKVNLGNCSYDVSLGPYYFVPNPDKTSLCPWSESDIAQYWLGPFEAASREDCPFGPVIAIKPGQTILCHTQEFIGSTSGARITTKMQTRSSLMRSGVSFCLCAGLGDCGYHNRWTMEVTNHSQSATIYLPVGKRVAQIVFFYCGQPSRDYTSRGNYQTSSNLQEIKSSWVPQMMLPKLYCEK